MKKIKIIINGSSSFTGYHFINYLSQTKKYDLTCLISKGYKNYDQQERINKLKKIKELKIINGINYLSNEFFEILRESNNYILILHYAYNSNYKNDDKFDINKFLKTNIFNIENLYQILNKNCKKVILSNSYFQKSNHKIAFNKYGLSKDISYLFHEYYCKKFNIMLKVNIIPNPIGEYEEKRFLCYIFTSWNNNIAPTILSPNDKNDYVLINNLAYEFSKFIHNKKHILSVSQYYETNYNFILRLKKIYEKITKKKVNIKVFKTKKIFDRKNKQQIKKDQLSLIKYVKYAIEKYK